MDAVPDESTWRPLYRAGAVAALLVPALIPMQALLVVTHPPPSTAKGYFALLERNPWLALASLDGLYALDMLLVSLVVVAVCVAIGRAGSWLTTLALFSNVSATAIYFAFNPTLELLALGKRYAIATSDAERTIGLAAGDAALLVYQGVAYDVSFVLAAAAGLMLGVAMLRTNVFDDVTAYVGLVTNVLALATIAARANGLAVAALLIAPLSVWLVRIARRLLELPTRDTRPCGENDGD